MVGRGRCPGYPVIALQNPHPLPFRRRVPRAFGRALRSGIRHSRAVRAGWQGASGSNWMAIMSSRPEQSADKDTAFGQ